MSSKQEERQERQERLQEWLKGSPQEWLDLVDEVQELREYKVSKLVQHSCLSREFTAGECSVLDEIVRHFEDIRYAEKEKEKVQEANQV